MKKTIVLFLLFSSTAFAQSKRIIYAPYQLGTDTTITYAGNFNSGPDSVFAILKSTGKIAGVPIWHADEYRSSDTTFSYQVGIDHYRNNYPSPIAFLAPSIAGPWDSTDVGKVLTSSGASAPSWQSALFGEITYDTILPVNTPVTNFLVPRLTGVRDTVFLVQPHGVDISLFDSASANTDTERAVIDGFLNGVRDTFTTINLPSGGLDTTVSQGAGVWDSLVSVTFYGDTTDVVQLATGEGGNVYVSLRVDLTVDPVVTQMDDGIQGTPTVGEFIGAYGRGHHFSTALFAGAEGSGYAPFRFYYTIR